MGQQIVHRLLISFPALLGVLFLCFCLLQVVPADPAMIIAGPDAKAETIAAIRLELGLDRSIPIQFFEYIMRVLRGDLGRSIISNKMVSEELALTIGPTVELMLGGMLIAIPFGLTLGTLAAVRRGTLVRVDRADASTAMFRVREVSQVAKTSFPTDLVYAPTLDPTLRLVTCGGSFDRERGSYRDNVIVFADQI
jgi:ABC-type dipeptide/oligopeptide/nickel transport system permease component